jgi:hypothetical protein
VARLGRETSKLYHKTIVFLLILIANNTVNYQTTKKSLNDQYISNMKSIADNIVQNIEASRVSTRMFEDMIGEKLRSDAIALKYALPKQAKDVSNEQLVELSKELRLQGISLFEQKPNEIEITKSSEPKELGQPTSSWGLWYKAFNELFADRNVSIEWGQRLEHYWSGPYEIATSDTSNIYKWGYYYDGSTNYIIDPYIGDDLYNEYRDFTGINAIIARALEANPSILEVTGVNPATFGKHIEFTTESGETLIPLVHRPYFFGSYNYENEREDRTYIDKALESNQLESYEQELNGGRVTKIFIPITSSILEDAMGPETSKGELDTLDRYVLLFATDTRELYAPLRKRMVTLVTTIALVSTLSVQLNDIIQIGQPELAAIIQAKSITAAGKKITLHIDMDSMSRVFEGMKSMDVVRIVGNLLDNAIEEGELHEPEHRWVECVGRVRERTLALTVANPVNKGMTELQSKLLHHTGFSTKNRANGHMGIGLSIVEDLTTRHKGAFDYEIVEDCFVATVVIPFDTQFRSLGQDSRTSVGS